MTVVPPGVHETPVGVGRAREAKPPSRHPRPGPNTLTDRCGEVPAAIGDEAGVASSTPANAPTRAPGSNPGSVGAALEGRLVAGKGAGFPQAHISRGTA